MSEMNIAPPSADASVAPMRPPIAFFHQSCHVIPQVNPKPLLRSGMESHDVWEENAVLRHRIKHVESKLRAVVRALEQQNKQIRQQLPMNDALQTEFAEAQEAANTQSAFVADGDETIERLADMIDHLREISRQQSTMNAQMASELRDKILPQMLQPVDALNRISQARIPAEQAFEELNNRRQLEEEGYEDPGPPGAVRRPECERCDTGSGSRDALAGRARSAGAAAAEQ
jgi:hypothetical protein